MQAWFLSRRRNKFNVENLNIYCKGKSNPLCFLNNTCWEICIWRKWLPYTQILKVNQGQIKKKKQASQKRHKVISHVSVDKLQVARLGESQCTTSISCSNSDCECPWNLQDEFKRLPCKSFANGHLSLLKTMPGMASKKLLSVSILKEYSLACSLDIWQNRVWEDCTLLLQMLWADGW